MEMHKFEKWFVNSDFCNLFHKIIFFPSLFRFINKELKGRVLEIGCGVGETSKLISKEYKNIKIISIDYDKSQIYLAKKRNGHLKNVKFEQGDGTKLNFKNEEFDYVLETEALHHIKEYPKVIKESARVLKRGGHFYIMDFTKQTFIWPIRQLFPPESMFTKQELFKLLEDNDFKINNHTGIFMIFIDAVKVK